MEHPRDGMVCRSPFNPTYNISVATWTVTPRDKEKLFIASPWCRQDVAPEPWYRPFECAPTFWRKTLSNVQIFLDFSIADEDWLLAKCSKILRQSHRAAVLKCGPQTSSISSTWELFRNASSQPPPQTHWESGTLEVGSGNLCLMSLPGDSEILQDENHYYKGSSINPHPGVKRTESWLTSCDT